MTGFPFNPDLTSETKSAANVTARNRNNQTKYPTWYCAKKLSLKHDSKIKPTQAMHTAVARSIGSAANGAMIIAAIPRCHECSAVFSRRLPVVRRFCRSTSFRRSTSRKNCRVACTSIARASGRAAGWLSALMAPKVLVSWKLPASSYSRGP